MSKKERKRLVEEDSSVALIRVQGGAKVILEILPFHLIVFDIKRLAIIMVQWLL